MPGLLQHGVEESGTRGPVQSRFRLHEDSVVGRRQPEVHLAPPAPTRWAVLPKDQPRRIRFRLEHAAQRADQTPDQEGRYRGEL